ncbi:unnamed protein product (macronuclear) [Paramecium tetraurelia]|uniref:Uncharacterized protein n=1 Tax=Paramecium tetraurelia TaxID=5888 RepID=A0CAM1_PARTE|nr:uncharacterized protein GSPATT00036619001 [Paramecium tetraurelia]CAK67838.1 unnamed protein product [Paramecium tetraurelia]|eukprot:XP_001435235.1 hypothetical protein (macronuclear) [Paramecium tetraurelia strain d4-2]
MQNQQLHLTYIYYSIILILPFTERMNIFQILFVQLIIILLSILSDSLILCNYYKFTIVSINYIVLVMTFIKMTKILDYRVKI